MIELIIFIFKFIITNLVCSIILAAIVMHLDKQGRYSSFEILLYSLGLGPIFVTLLLYYLFIVTPYRSNLFYIEMIFGAFFLMFLAGMKNHKKLYRMALETIKRVRSSRIGNRYYYTKLMISLFLIGVIIIFYMMVFLPRPLIDHDILGYGIMGEILFKEKSLEPIWIENFSEKGFIYVTKHAPSFSLLLSWEEFINSIFKIKSDLYFKSISAYYGFLILLIQYYWVSKYNKWLSLLAAFCLLSGTAFYLVFIQRSIDSYRIFFFCSSYIFLGYAIKNNDSLSISMLGAFSGLTAFTHRIGVVLCMINLICFMMLIDSKLKTKILKCLLVFLIIIAFGGVHYVFDIILGRGTWIQPK